MNAEQQTELILPQVETWVAELEQAVQSFEEAVTHAEQCMDEVEHAERAHGEGDASALQLLLTQALHVSHEVEERVTTTSGSLSEALEQAEQTSRKSAPTDELAPLQVGTLVCRERYRVVQLLHSRPRVHLYLARRVPDPASAGAATPVDAQSPDATSAQPLVAIRELVLNGLPPELRQCIEHAAFEEFAASQLFGTPHLPGVGDRGYLENERHYLIMQARQVRGSAPTSAILLSELIFDQPQGSARPDLASALNWGTQLCQIVAHLHGMQNVLGELTPDMLLVDREGRAPWAPILLAGWPPAPPFWPGASQGEEYHQVFPVRYENENAPVVSDEQVFAAPEIRAGLRDERSDVYALGAILYLLFTGHAPPVASTRLQLATTPASPRRGDRKADRQRSRRTTEHEREQEHTLTPPHLLNKRISPLLEQVVLRALALNPEQRFANAQDLSEALEGVQLKAETAALPPAKASRLRRLLEWIRK